MARPNDGGEAQPMTEDPKTGRAAAERPAPVTLQPSVGAALHDVARLMKRRFERRARQTGLSITRQQARALLYVARNEGLSQAAVASGLDIEPIALVRLLDRLHEEGLVDRHSHPTDRRVRTLWLTAAAWEVLDHVLAINREVREEACAGLSPSDREILMRTLYHMKANLDLADNAESAAAE
ncbi:MAG TPA: MarR family transcriptional regulator [Stellaceae bacterium]|nr:MarR family transcriptional regulator [Stellaceae bacterium]